MGDFVYSNDPELTILQTMVCLFRIIELMPPNSVNLEISIPIITYLQDKDQFKRAHVHSLYAFQNADFVDLLQNAAHNDGHIKIRMLYECHAENLYHLGAFTSVRDCTAEFICKFGHIPITSYRMHHLCFFSNIQLKEFDAGYA